MAPDLNERSRRMWAAVEAASLGRGGPSAMAAATGLSRNTIRAGLQALRKGSSQTALPPARIRQRGGGRKPLTQTYGDLAGKLRSLVESSTRGDPESPLLWTCKSTRKLAAELAVLGCPASYRTVARLLRAWDYSLQSKRKVREGANHPDRNAQFEYISRQVRLFQRRGQPVISVDTKKELVGDFRNAGREWRPKGQPLEVRVHDRLVVSHLPPGTSKWNKLEHRLFCHITQNWRGRPLASHEIIVKLISSTTTAHGLHVRAALDRRHYPTRNKVTAKELAQLNLLPPGFHGDWNYTLIPV